MASSTVARHKVLLSKRFAGMKRDINLARAILLRIEEDDRLDGANCFVGCEFEMEGHSADEVTYHFLLLLDAGFLIGNYESGIPVVSRLSWQGCEFLDDTRDPEIWDKTKERAKSLGGIGAAFIWELAKSEIKKKLAL